MTWAIVGTVVVKDLTLFFKNQFFAFVSVLGVVAYAVAYFLMPATVDETIQFGLYAPGLPQTIISELADGGLVLDRFDSEAALKESVIERDHSVGVMLPEDFIARLAAEEDPRVQIYVTPDVTAEFQELYALLFEELAFMFSGRTSNLVVEEEVLGVDRVGDQIPPRDRMLPLFAVFILMVETLGLASLISSEIESGTLQALLVTPMTVEGLFLGKGITGVGLAFVQATALMAITGGLSRQPILVLTALLLGSVLVTGVAFLISSVARDLMSVMAWGMLALLILAIPSLNVALPGLISNWIRIIPSYYLVDTVHRVVNAGAGWGSVGGNLLILLAFSAAILFAGVVTLRRKFR